MFKIKTIASICSLALLTNGYASADQTILPSCRWQGHKDVLPIKAAYERQAKRQKQTNQNSLKFRLDQEMFLAYLSADNTKMNDLLTAYRNHEGKNWKSPSDIIFNVFLIADRLNDFAALSHVKQVFDNNPFYLNQLMNGGRFEGTLFDATTIYDYVSARLALEARDAKLFERHYQSTVRQLASLQRFRTKSATFQERVAKSELLLAKLKRLAIEAGLIEAQGWSFGRIKAAYHRLDADCSPRLKTYAANILNAVTEDKHTANLQHKSPMSFKNVPVLRSESEEWSTWVNANGGVILDKE